MRKTAPEIPVGRGGLAKPTCPPQAETSAYRAGSPYRGFKKLTPAQLKVLKTLIETEFP
jgi:hypothetical protein